MAPEQRREQLLDAALAVVLAEGYAGVSIEAIARMAGVTRPVVYDHFANLGLLIRALIAREEQYALTQLAEVAPDVEHVRETDVATLMNVGIPHFLEAVASRPATWRLILLPLAGTPAIVREHVEANRALVRGRMQDVISAGVESGQLAPELDVELAARAIMALGEDAARMVLTDAEEYSPERYEAFIRLLTARLLP